MFFYSPFSLIALASVAKENNYCRPELTMTRILEIKGGKHPLQELCVDNFVPNDTLSGDDHTLMKIITGPNSSGKSVYLKQVIFTISTDYGTKHFIKCSIDPLSLAKRLSSYAVLFNLQYFKIL